jgi:hypothetical protein
VVAALKRVRAATNGSGWTGYFAAGPKRRKRSLQAGLQGAVHGFADPRPRDNPGTSAARCVRLSRAHPERRCLDSRLREPTRGLNTRRRSSFCWCSQPPLSTGFGRVASQVDTPEPPLAGRCVFRVPRRPRAGDSGFFGKNQTWAERCLPPAVPSPCPRTRNPAGYSLIGLLRQITRLRFTGTGTGRSTCSCPKSGTKDVSRNNRCNHFLRARLGSRYRAATRGSG